MFKLVIELPDKLQEPLEEIVSVLTSVNKMEMTPTVVITKVVRDYIAKQYADILVKCVEKPTPPENCISKDGDPNLKEKKDE